MLFQAAEKLCRNCLQVNSHMLLPNTWPKCEIQGCSLIRFWSFCFCLTGQNFGFRTHSWVTLPLEACDGGASRSPVSSKYGISILFNQTAQITRSTTVSMKHILGNTRYSSRYKAHLPHGSSALGWVPVCNRCGYPECENRPVSPHCWVQRWTEKS